MDGYGYFKSAVEIGVKSGSLLVGELLLYASLLLEFSKLVPPEFRALLWDIDPKTAMSAD